MTFYRIIKTLYATILITLTAQVSFAQDDKSLVHIANSVFDLRTDVSKVPRTYSFFPLTEVRWLSDLVDHDPLLYNTVLHFRTKTQVEGQPKTTFFSIRSEAFIQKHWPVTENIPEIFQIDGLETRRQSLHGYDLFFRPTQGNNRFFASCAIREPERLFCTVSADYPPDPDIYLFARIYRAKPPFNFAKIANRLREIAYCLDVTQAVKQPDFMPKLIDENTQALPTFRNCNELGLGA